ncbi:MAG: hypothetical protein M1436_10540 [Acidobacteria bacterium]|nr:hypothetical protein [Acidobacteriota bacterium]
MELVRAIMRFFSYLYHGLLALFLLAIAFLAIATNSHTLHLDMLPWSGKALSYWLFFGALFGLATLVLAVKGIARVLFFAWSVVVLLFLLKGYIFSNYYFRGGQYQTALLLGIGAAIAVAGAWFQLRAEPKMKKKFY